MITKLTLQLIFVLTCLCHAQQTIDTTLTHARVQREYLLYIPVAYSADTPTPLLINFHGLNQFRDGFMEIADFRSIANTTGIILVYPQALPSMRDGDSRWNCGYQHGAHPDDIGFTEAMIDTIASMYNIDQTRVYASGYSNGGYMCQAAACYLNERIAAIAPVKGSMRDFTRAKYEHLPLPPTPVLMINNTGDGKVSYGGADGNLSIRDVIQFWVDSNNCDADADSTRLGEIDEDDDVVVDHIVYSSGDNGVNVELILEKVNIHNMQNDGHSYPKSSERSLWYFDSPTEVWRFLSRYDINGLIEPREVEFSDDFTNQDFRLLQNFPNPFNQTTSITFTLKSPGNVNLSIFDVLGNDVEVLLNHRMNAGSSTKDFFAEDLPNGIYFAKLTSENASQVRKMVLLR
ncbi:MAG: T9SS type A sorting domain-containing protein [Calditrichaeota bacterium]|nr:T9SS type A sorting domain-containing protein [Calditrichota bacterium]